MQYYQQSAATSAAANLANSGLPLGSLGMGGMGGLKQRGLPASTPLTINAIAQMNNENNLRALTQQQVYGGDPNAIGPTHKVTKQLPEIPMSNRRLLYNMKKNNNTKTQASLNFTWSSSFPSTFNQLPPTIPPIRLNLSHEKQKRLADILNESDSEDEKMIIPRSTTGIDIGKLLKYYKLHFSL
jgi:hypothetical protein